MWIKGLHDKRDVDSLLNDIHNLVDDDSDYEFDSGEAIEVLSDCRGCIKMLLGEA